MAKATRFSSEAESYKHMQQSALVAHQGDKYFYPKGHYVTERNDEDDTGKPILLGENGRLDYSLLTGYVAYPRDIFDGDPVPVRGEALSFGIRTISSATTANDYLGIARIELSGNYMGGWIQLKGVVGSTLRENHPVELEVQMATDGAGALVTPVVTLRGRLSSCNFFIYAETDGGGSGIHYCTVYWKSTANWQTLNAEVRAQIADATDCNLTVWQGGNNVGESTPSGTLAQVNNYWSVYNEFRTYDDDGVYYGNFYANSTGVTIKSINVPLYFNYGVSQTILCFAGITSGNPQFKVYGYQTATGVKYADMYVSADGAAWVRGEEYLRLCALGNYVDILPNNASYGMVVRKHDANGVAGSPYANFFVEDATVDYLNIVLGAVGSTLGLVVNDNEEVGVNKVPTSGYKLDVNGIIRGTRLESTQATGTAPLTVASTTKVTNLNADSLDGYHSTSFPQLVAISGAGTEVGITVSASWQDLDVTSQTSANATWVYLFLHTYTLYDTHDARIVVCAYNDNVVYADCRVYGGSRIAYDAHGSGASGATYNSMCVWVPLDSEQRFSYYADQSAQGYIGDGTPHIKILAYIEEK